MVSRAPTTTTTSGSRWSSCPRCAFTLKLEPRRRPRPTTASASLAQSSPKSRERFAHRVAVGPEGAELASSLNADDDAVRLGLEISVVVLVGGLWYNAVDSVRTVIGTAVSEQKSEVALASKLRETELRLLSGDYGDEEAAEEARRDARRMRALLMKMEREAEKGERIKIERGFDAKPLTFATYFSKSFRSLLLNRQANLKDGKAPALQSAVTLGLLLCFAWQLSGLIGLAMDPART